VVNGRLTTALAIAGASVFAGCAKPPTTPGPPTTTITITAAGVSPKSVQIALGARVLFINNDSRSHYIHSDPHPDATGCPEINQIGILQIGDKRETGNFVDIATCGYHDHDTPSNDTFKGTIVIK